MSKSKTGRGLATVPIFILVPQVKLPKRLSLEGPARERTGINVMTRLMGLILAAMAVELLADGLVKLFPILASPTLR